MSDENTRALTECLNDIHQELVGINTELERANRLKRFELEVGRIPDATPDQWRASLDEAWEG